MSTAEPTGGGHAAKGIEAAARRVLAGELLARADALQLAGHAVQAPCEMLHWAGRIRSAHFGRSVRLCSIVPGRTGACGEDCKWCAQSVHSCAPAAAPTRTAPADIIHAAQDAFAAGATCFSVVNSGRRPSTAELDDVCQAVRAIRADHPAGAVTLAASLGALTAAQADQLAAAGVTRYHHNLETSSAFFTNVVSTHTYAERVETLRAARRAGLEICCGGIFGIGEAWPDRVDLALALRDEVRPHHVPLNFLHPIPGTALGESSGLPALECLLIIAVFRILMPTTPLTVGGGRLVNLRDLQSWIFQAGATGLLVGNYLTTLGRPVEDDLRMIRDLGLEPADAGTTAT